MTRDEFLRLPRFMSTQDTDEPREMVAISAFGIIPLTHCSESEEAEAAVPVLSSIRPDEQVFATQLWVSVDRIIEILDDPMELSLPAELHDAGGYKVIVDGHHREAARTIVG